MPDYTQPDHVEKRLRYFDGQFLVVQDFVDEQKYHIDRQRRQTRLLRTSGILEGLQVTQASDSAESVSVEVAPGTAIDLKGRAIILSEKHVVDLTEHIGTTVTLAIAYLEEDSDLPTSDRGSRDLTRWHEKVAFEVVKNGETSTLDGAIDIVQIKINANRIVDISTDHTFNNFYSGLKFGNTDLRNPEISLKPVSRGLQLTGNLTISGSLTASGNLTANQDIVARRVLTFPLANRSNNQEINFGRGEYGIGVQPDTQYFRTAKNFAWYKDGVHSNEALNPGANGNLQMSMNEGGDLSIANSLSIAKSLTVGQALSIEEGSNDQAISFTRDGSYGIGVQADTQYFRTAKNFAWYQSGSHNNTSLNPGGGKVQMILNSEGRVGVGTSNPEALLDVNGAIRSSSLVSSSLVVNGRLTVHHCSITTSQGVRFYDGSRQSSAATFKPKSYGSINNNGSVDRSLSASNVASSAYNGGTNAYFIRFRFAFSLRNFLVLVTPYNRSVLTRVRHAGADLEVSFSLIGGQPTSTDFSFLILDPEAM